jgi:CheY-like chemotaxis protein
MNVRILVVDCNAFARNSLAALLVERGYDVTQTGDAVLAIDLIHSRAFDVVVCDQYSRAEPRGADVLGFHYRRRPAGGRILLVTDAGSGRRSAELINAVCLIKPVEHRALLRAVETLVAAERSPETRGAR